MGIPNLGEQYNSQYEMCLHLKLKRNVILTYKVGESSNLRFPEVLLLLLNELAFCFNMPTLK